MVAPLVVLACAFGMRLLELRRPGRAWPEVAGWLPRAIALNALQVAVVLLSGRLLEPWCAAHRPWSAAALGVAGGALVSYVAITFVFYWWHRARHASPFLWRWFHQLHHSPQRLETWTSFYKHPFELAANALLTAAVAYGIVGVEPRVAAITCALTGVAELFYHWNVATPAWLGPWIQRPEAHCVHHESGRHSGNFGDLPLWDRLFGTYRDPAIWSGRCGFGEREHEVARMLAGIDVDTPVAGRAANRRIWTIRLLLLLGLLQIGAEGLGRIAGAAGSGSGAAALRAVKGIAAASGASPNPKVFTAVQGFETFTHRGSIAWMEGSEKRQVEIDAKRYRGLRGPYLRRNAYGAALAYGPVLDSSDATRPLFRTVAHHALGGAAPLLQELGIDASRRSGPIELSWECVASHPFASRIEIR